MTQTDSMPGLFFTAGALLDRVSGPNARYHDPSHRYGLEAYIEHIDRQIDRLEQEGCDVDSYRSLLNTLKAGDYNTFHREFIKTFFS